MAERRLIDANALVFTRVQIFHGMKDDGTPLVGGFNAVVMSSVIKDAPTIDAVEVVRCKDCKHSEPNDGGALWCNHWDDEVEFGFFCGDGERRDSDG